MHTNTLTGFLLSEQQNCQFSQEDNSSHVSENVNKILQSVQVALIWAGVDSGVILEPTVGAVGKVNHAHIHRIRAQAGLVIAQVFVWVIVLRTAVIHDEKWAGVEPVRVMWLNVPMKVLKLMNDRI